MKASFAQTNRGVQRGEATESDVERRNRSSWAKVPVLLFKDWDERGGHYFLRLACALMKISAGSCVGVCRVFFRRWMGCKPAFLFIDELGRLFAEVADGLERKFAGDVVGGVVGR